MLVVIVIIAALNTKKRSGGPFFLSGSRQSNDARLAGGAKLATSGHRDNDRLSINLSLLRRAGGKR